MGRRNTTLVAAFASLAVAALVLYALARDPGDSSPEAAFAREMSVHHAQAVEMASIVQRRTENEEVRTLANDIALTQQAQIGRMAGWLSVWGLPSTGPDSSESRMPGMAGPSEVNRLRDLPPEEADELFLRLMVAHHRAALPMAAEVLQETSRPEVERLATAIRDSQKAEIQTMQDMLRRMGAPPEESEPEMDM